MNKLLLNIQMFAEFNANLTDLIKKHTADDVFNGEDALKDLNDQILKYNSKNQPKVETFKDKAREEVIKELGIENVTNENQLKAHIASLSSDEKSQENIRLTNDLKEITDKYTILDKDYKTTSGKLNGFLNEKVLINDGANPKDVDYDVFQINKLVSDEKDFTQASEEYKLANPNRFNAEITPTTKQPITTGKPRVVVQTKEISGVRQKLIDKGLLKE